MHDNQTITANSVSRKVISTNSGFNKAIKPFTIKDNNKVQYIKNQAKIKLSNI